MTHPASFATLTEQQARTIHDIVCQARTDTSSVASGELQNQLLIYKQLFISLLDDIPKNTKDRELLRTGNALIHGVERSVDNDFVRETIFLSDQLNINEWTAATLLTRGKNICLRTGGYAIDTAVLLYYDERLYLLATLEVILASIKDAFVSDDIQPVFHQFALDLMKTQTDTESPSPPSSSPSTTTKGSLVSKLLQISIRIKKQIDCVSTSGGMVIPNNNNNGNTSSTSAAEGKLGEAIISKRLDRMTDERIYIVQILYHLASLFQLSQVDIFDMLGSLQLADLTDVTVPYLLTALLTTISTKKLENDKEREMDDLQSDVSFIDLFHNKLVGNLFRVPAIKAAVALQWSLFVKKARTLYDHVADFTVASEEAITQLTYGAIETKVFQFLNEYILYFQQPNAKVDTNRYLLKNTVLEELENAADEMTVDPTDFTKFNADIRTDFYPFVLFELENMALGLIEGRMDVLRKLKYREEDSSQSVTAPLESKNALLSSNDAERCRDLEYFYTLLASIYRGRLNEGVIFWNDESSLLNRFIHWTTDIKVAGTVGACYEFLGSISTGDQCATLAFRSLDAGSDRMNLASSSLFSWGTLFATLHFYIPLLRDAKDDPTVMLPAMEEDLLIKFLYLLQQVVSYSTEARSTLWADSYFRVCDSIVEILNYVTSTTLRASLYDTLGAFCTSWGGGINGTGAQISSQVWEVLENSNYFINSKLQGTTGYRHYYHYQQLRHHHQSQPESMDSDSFSIPMDVEQLPGFLQDFELERSHHVYPETLAVLRLFGSAIHAQSKRDELLNGFRPIRSTLQSFLGRSTRTPGARPYIALLINDIFVSLPDQVYKYPGTRWQLTSTCLRVLENSLLSFDLRRLEEFAANSSCSSRGKTQNGNDKAFGSMYTHLSKKEGSLTASALHSLLLEYVTHPGYSVMVHVLSGDSFCKQLLDIIELGIDGVSNKRECGPYFIECIIRGLRIIHRVLELRNSFCGVLVPYITGLSNRSATAEFKLMDYTFDALPTLVPLEQRLLCQANALVQIAMLMNCEDHEEICYLSTQILDALSTTTNKHDITARKGFKHTGTYVPTGGLGSRIAVILDACKDSEAIVYGVAERLEIEQQETVTCDDYEFDRNNIPFWNATLTLENKYNYDDNLNWLRRTCSVRIAILDFLLGNIAVDTESPSMTEYILGYMNLDKKHQHRQMKDTLSIAFRAILDMMRIHEEDTDGMEIDEDDATNHSRALIETHPILAEKCYQLIYRLCAREATSITTLRYLRNEEEFFYKQFKLLSARFGTSVSVEHPTFPGVMVYSDGSRIKTDFFQLLSTLHQRAWLLKSLALELHYTSAMQQKAAVVRLLTLLFGPQLDTRPSSSTSSSPSPSTPPSYVHTAKIEQDLVKTLEMISSLEFRWDDDLLDTMSDFTPSIFTDLRAEEYEIVNERQCLVYDIRTIDSKLWDQLNDKQVQGAITTPEELEAAQKEIRDILQHLMAENHVREIVHGRVHCLQAWKQVVQVALTECFDYFPTEIRQPIIYALLMAVLQRMQPKEGFDTDILKSLSELTSTLMIQLRGQHRQQSDSTSLLSANAGVTVTSVDIAYRLTDDKVVQLFASILETMQERSTTVAVRGDMYTALVNLLQYVRQYHPNATTITTATASQQQRSVESRLVDLLFTRYQTILDTICNDSCFGLGVWRTTAFTALNSLYMLTCQVEVDDTKYISCLQKENFLRYCVDMIRNDDQALMTILAQPDASLLPLYIYEVKISLFTNIASRRNGAHVLVENGIVDVLGQCNFIGTRPTTTADKDADKILTERYDQLLLPTLRLIVTLLFSLGRINEYFLEKVENWVKKQQDTLVYILRHDDNNVALTSLNELKFVVAIMYYLSCRPGYFKNLVHRNLNSLHVSMVQLRQKLGTPDDLLSKVTPVTDAEKTWMETQVSDLDPVSVFTDKSRKLIGSISDYVKAYEMNFS